MPPLAARPRYLICRRRIAQRHSFGLDSEFTRAGCFLIFQLVCRTSVPKKRETRRRPLSKWCIAFSIGYRNFLRLKQEGATGRDLTEWGLRDFAPLLDRLDARKRARTSHGCRHGACCQRGNLFARPLYQYSGIEYAVAELVSRAALHEAYSNLGHPPFGHTKKLKRLHQIIKIEGPITSYRDDIQPWLDEFAQYEDHRHFLAHAIMVPRSREHISFTMYDHREGVYSVGQLELELKHLEVVATLISPISSEFTSLVAKICREIPLPAA